VISLDFELHWGVRHKTPADGPYRKNLLGAREAIPALLKLFDEFNISATWATVGFLFAHSKEELRHFWPSVKPRYRAASLFPYAESVGANEAADPLHYAPTLIEKIKDAPRQEVATHTLSHYFCLAPGQHEEAFEADLQSALRVARKNDIQIQSIVFPKNQHNTAYDDVLRRNGITSYRGPANGWMYRASSGQEDHLGKRGARLMDAYSGLLGRRTVPWEQVSPLPKEALSNVPGSLFLRPHSRMSPHRLHLRRIEQSIEHAATSGEIFHLWWHPHNFGCHLEENLSSLESIFRTFARHRDCHGMRSLSMADVAATVTLEASSPS